jgi:pimeloyl-ACP methyl ester carboxylesterase
MKAQPEGFASLAEVAAAIRAYNPHRKRPASESGLRRVVRQREDGRWYWHWDPAYVLGPASGRDRRRAAPEELLLAARDLERRHIPTLLVRGRQSDVLSEELAREFLDLVPGAAYADVEGAGHMVAGDENDIFSEALLAFLRALPPPPGASFDVTGLPQ